MNKIYKFFSSPILALALLVAFATAMAKATFIENDFGTPAAWALVYDAWWFEWIMIGLGISFAFNIKKYRLWRREKWPILFFHVAFIVILIGAGITRFHSHGGVMRIREAAESNILISDQNYLSIDFGEGNPRLEKEMYFTPVSNGEFTLETQVGDKSVEVSYADFIVDAEPKVVDLEEGGEPMIQMVVSRGMGRETIFLKRGEVEFLGEGLMLGFDTDKEGVINISQSGDSLRISSPVELGFFIMASQEAGTLAADSLQNLKLRTLHRIGDVSFVPLSFHPHGSFELASGAAKPKDNDELKDDALQLLVKIGEDMEVVSVLYRKGFIPHGHEYEVGGLPFTVSYGARPMTLPFSIALEDFQLERYPGSVSPSAYASEVVVKDGGEEFPFRIFMNNVLDYRGYRFFQASYDTDELGTVLSVNYDALGTNVSYIGYLLMGLGMFLALFSKNSRFFVINKQLKKLKAGKGAVIAILLLLGASGNVLLAQPDLGVVVHSQAIDVSQSDKFGRLLVQDLDGRIKPINSLASEFLRKISRSTHYKYEIDGERQKLDANQVFLAIHRAPNMWVNLPLIKVDKKKGGPELQDLPSNENGLVAFSAFIDTAGNYVLLQAAEIANAKKPANHSEADKELIKVDERFNILFQVLSGEYLKIFPNKNDPNDTWFSPTHHFQDFPEDDGLFAQYIMPTYFEHLAADSLSAAAEDLEYIATYQRVLAADIVPSEEVVEAELFYNKLNLNFWLFQLFFTTGFIMLVLAIVKIFVQNRVVNLIWTLVLSLIVLGFLAFAANIILRWYVSGHAPWSNGYEMLVFVAWVLCLCGLLTARKSDFALPLATLFTGALLFVSYLDWLSPEITNLMPVLKSVWLKVHVATIVSSYAPLALSAVLGFMALLLIIFKTPENARKMDVKIKELSLINESSMTIGVFVLAIGTFLGGVWANESWGRYWAWDPKETWALISIIVYAVVLHLRFVPGLNTRYALNAASVFAFGSIIMTSFGVNYYLSGLHSYAAGDPLPIPTFIYVLVAVVFLVSLLAFWRYRAFKKK